MTDPVTKRVARRFQAAQSLNEMATELKRVEKLRAKISRIERKIALPGYNWPEEDEPVTRKALASVQSVGREISELLHKAYDMVEQFTQTAQASKAQAKHNLENLEKRLAHEKPWLDKWDDLVRDPVHYAETSLTSYGAHSSAVGNAFGHFWVQSRERYTAIRAMLTIAQVTSHMLDAG